MSATAVAAMNPTAPCTASFIRQRLRTCRMTSIRADRGSLLCRQHMTSRHKSQSSSTRSDAYLPTSDHALARDMRCASTDSPVNSRIPAKSRYHQIRCAFSWASSGMGVWSPRAPALVGPPTTAADDFGRIHGCPVGFGQLHVARHDRDELRLPALLANFVIALLGQARARGRRRLRAGAAPRPAPAPPAACSDRPPATGR